MSPHARRQGGSFANLLVLGASGHVAQAVLRRLGGRRDHFRSLVLLDRNEQVLHSPFLEHSRLHYQFIRRRLRFPDDRAEYHQLLRRHRIDIVLDLTDMDTPGVFDATDSAGVSYINTALNDSSRGIAEVVHAMRPVDMRPCRAAHIVGSGMNPGVVNVWVMHAVRHYGVPREIVHFEYDTSMAVDRWRPMITWSRREFLTETVWEPTGLVRDGRVLVYQTNALQNHESLRPVMQPVVRLPSYPRAALVLHEENVRLGRQLGVSSRYLYAIDPRTMAFLAKRWRERGTVLIGDLEVGDNTTTPLLGSDTIGVCLQYPRRRVYYLHSLSNASVVGTNATCAQVAVGVYAALMTMLSGTLRRGLYSPEQLYDTLYPHVIFSNLRVEHFICTLRKGQWSIQKHLPELRPQRAGLHEQMII